ncbi:MAG: hypothetical protein K2Y18_03405 [Alphaproteobacteria bacterium]|jgi:hypothetical protein|nr:hypothetical protein [Alphaproteobacteria bacterium]
MSFKLNHLTIALTLTGMIMNVSPSQGVENEKANVVEDHKKLSLQDAKEQQEKNLVLQRTEKQVVSQSEQNVDSQNVISSNDNGSLCMAINVPLTYIGPDKTLRTMTTRFRPSVFYKF